MGYPWCSGLMTHERFSDRLEFALHAEFAGWHCISCGEILDRLVLANRRRWGICRSLCLISPDYNKQGATSLRLANRGVALFRLKRGRSSSEGYPRRFSCVMVILARGRSTQQGLLGGCYLLDGPYRGLTLSKGRRRPCCVCVAGD